jgi:GNAT superfamily N-acetyltransferase
MTSLTLDRALSRRIELAEAQAAAAAAEALAEFRPHAGVAVTRIAGGFAVYCGANSPVTQAVGLGLDGPVNDEEFDALERFYASRKEPVRVETSPLVDRTLIEQFGKRRYRVTEFTNVMARSTSETRLSSAVRETGDGITVERVAREHMDLWNLTVAQGFAEHHPVTQEILDVMRAFASAPQVECYLARVNGAVAGGGTIILRDGLAGLFGASTLPGYRKRGVQAALLESRIARAAECGCDLVVCLAQPGSTSQRNVMRRGFSVLYTRVKFEREIASSSPAPSV